MNPDERREFSEAIVEAMTSRIGPMHDMTKSLMAAQVDGLIDARRSFVNAGWPEWLILATLEAMITGRRSNRGVPSAND